MPRIGALLLLPLLLGAVQGLRAQTVPDAATTALVRELLELTQVAEQALTVMEKAIEAQRRTNPEIPAIFWDRFMIRARERKGELIALLMPVYQSAFSTEDLRGLIAFYRTPVGKRLLAAQPEMTRASMEAGERWGAQLGGEIGKELADEGLIN